MTVDEVPALSQSVECMEVQVLGGDANFYGPASGMNCILDESSSVVLRVYEEPDATAEVIGDWSELITEENQLVYSGNWFATGPKSALETMFARYEKTGPVTSAPPSSPMSAEDSDRTLCSSVTYNVLKDSYKGLPESALEPYFENYPGMESLRDEVLGSARESGIDRYVADDEYRMDIFLTRFDTEIKEFCSKSDSD